MKILVPVDGSAASLDSVKKSLEIAKKYGFTIKLISVVDDVQVRLWPQPYDSGLLGAQVLVDQKALTETMQKSAEDLLNSVTTEMDFSGVTVEKEVLLGEPYMRILDAAKKDAVDLIVMGNRGFSKIKRFFVGSVTQKVISEAPCPVLVIHSEAAD